MQIRWYSFQIPFYLFDLQPQSSEVKALNKINKDGSVKQETVLHYAWSALGRTQRNSCVMQRWNVHSKEESKSLLRASLLPPPPQPFMSAAKEGCSCLGLVWGTAEQGWVCCYPVWEQLLVVLGTPSWGWRPCREWCSYLASTGAGKQQVCFVVLQRWEQKHSSLRIRSWALLESCSWVGVSFHCVWVWGSPGFVRMWVAVFAGRGSSQGSSCVWWMRFAQRSPKGKSVLLYLPGPYCLGLLHSPCAFHETNCELTRCCCL